MIKKLQEYGINSYKTIEDLPDARLKRFKTPIHQDRRKQVRIAVIDDQPFEAGVTLRNYGYEIEEIGDLKNISEVASFPIVLCDLMDVGRHFDKVNQGSSIIREIRKNYPAILVAAYTGSAMTAEPVRRARFFADGFIKKDAEIDTWVEELDRLISIATDARAIWLRTRTALVEEQIDTRSLLKLEDRYVDALKNGDQTFEGLKKLASNKNVGGAASNIVQGLIASSIFRIIVGG